MSPESDNVNLITAGSRFEGTVEFDSFTRFEGYIQGVLKGGAGSELIVGENGVIEGKVEGDTIIVDGFVRGDIRATSKVVITGTGRVVGEIRSPSPSIEFGGYFDGKCAMEQFAAAPTGNT
ncbi:MAG: polymer-forming cytoskeletal protein [Deltaproteobacteria bacterium]|nr:polymer-forming cytoskeletal protein [Deltaproteobacteria bacterium]